MLVSLFNHTKHYVKHLLSLFIVCYRYHSPELSHESEIYLHLFEFPSFEMPTHPLLDHHCGFQTLLPQQLFFFRFLFQHLYFSFLLILLVFLFLLKLGKIDIIVESR